MYESAPGEYVFDFGQNMAGIATLAVPEGVDQTPGTRIELLFAEAVHGPPPAPIFHHYGNAKETNTYITRGDGSAIEVGWGRGEERKPWVLGVSFSSSFSSPRSVHHSVCICRLSL